MALLRKVYYINSEENMEFTKDQILSLAPDQASISAGEKVYKKTAWDVKRSERALWAAIKGSGKNPYLTQIDLQNIAFKCSCPSRKFPCKHGLALGLYLCDQDLSHIPLEEEPLWVKEWIDKRQEKASKPAVKKVQSKEKRAEKITDKWQETAQSIEYFELWLSDLIKGGILPLSHYVYSDWQKTNKRDGRSQNHGT